MERPQVADGGDGLQIWRVPANILNKQSRTADKGWSSSLANNSSPYKISLLRYVSKGLGHTHTHSPSLSLFTACLAHSRHGFAVVLYNLRSCGTAVACVPTSSLRTNNYRFRRLITQQKRNRMLKDRSDPIFRFEGDFRN
jgi:hypothetical protein